MLRTAQLSQAAALLRKQAAVHTRLQQQHGVARAELSLVVVTLAADDFDGAARGSHRGANCPFRGGDSRRARRPTRPAQDGTGAGLQGSVASGRGARPRLGRERNRGAATYGACLHRLGLGLMQRGSQPLRVRCRWPRRTAEP